MQMLFLASWLKRRKRQCGLVIKIASDPLITAKKKIVVLHHRAPVPFYPVAFLFDCSCLSCTMASLEVEDCTSSSAYQFAECVPPISPLNISCVVPLVTLLNPQSPYLKGRNCPFYYHCPPSRSYCWHQKHSSCKEPAL